MIFLYLPVFSPHVKTAQFTFLNLFLELNFCNFAIWCDLQSINEFFLLPLSPVLSDYYTDQLILKAIRLRFYQIIKIIFYSSIINLDYDFTCIPLLLFVLFPFMSNFLCHSPFKIVVVALVTLQVNSIWVTTLFSTVSIFIFLERIFNVNHQTSDRNG